jgi:hypothetical protein
MFTILKFKAGVLGSRYLCSIHLPWWLLTFWKIFILNSKLLIKYTSYILPLILIHLSHIFHLHLIVHTYLHNQTVDMAQVCICEHNLANILIPI